jgi:hypothetical protein
MHRSTRFSQCPTVCDLVGPTVGALL